jgi:acid phosphatase
LDANSNGRCDRREETTTSDAGGSFVLRGSGPVVAEIGTRVTLHDPATGASTRVQHTLTFRAPAQANRVVSSISTELQAMIDANGGHFSQALGELSQRLGVSEDQVLGDPNRQIEPVRSVLRAEAEQLLDRIAAAVAESGRSGSRVQALRNRLALDPIKNVVVIYAENRAFDTLYGFFPGANGIRQALERRAPQRDRDGSVLAKLPPAWTGLTAAGQPVTITQAQTRNVLPNAPFQIDAASPPWGSPVAPDGVVTRDLVHKFFQNQMQIDGGNNDAFAAWSDAGGLVMGYYDGSQSAMWDIAKQYTLADNFFMGAFGGSFINHQYLICACAPEYPNADTAPAQPTIAALETDTGGNYLPRLARQPASPVSALDGLPVWVLDGNVTPKNYFGDGTFRAVNTMQTPYQPSGIAPDASDATGLYADPGKANTLPPQTQTHIGDLLTAKGIDWIWYAGGWNAALADRTKVYNPAHGNFQVHHQAFNYFAGFDPVAHAAERATHLKDYDDLIAAARSGTLPAVAFYKPLGIHNQHPGYASVADGDAHIAGLIATLQASPQWRQMLVIVTYDENGGFWDHVAPPKGDLLGPGTRIPALIVSPFAKRHFIDHTQYDTGSILRFLVHRYSLPVLDGLERRDRALAASGAAVMGDFTNALDFAKSCAAAARTRIICNRS